MDDSENNASDPTERERAIGECMKVIDARRIKLQGRSDEVFKFAADEMLGLLDDLTALSKGELKQPES